jgi:polysaccharide pyruvyl transferase WcaK-like protein
MADLATGPRLFLYGYYGFGNVGDDLLLNAVVTATLKLAPDARFVVRSLCPVDGVEPSGQIEFVALERVMSDQTKSRLRRFGQYVLATWKSLAGCSHVVFGGGTLFHARGNSSVNLALIFMLVVMARFRGATVYALGVGVAPLNGTMPKRLMRAILARVADFAVRDESSLDHCQGLAAGVQLRLTADLVFSLTLPSASRDQHLGRRPVVAMTLAASDIGNGTEHEHFLRQLAVALELLVRRGWSVCFLAFQELDQAGVKVSDTALFTRVQSCNPTLENSVVRMSASPDDIAQLFSTIDVVAGMRFHGHVLAAMQGMPFVGVGRDEKLKDLCYQLSMPFLDMGSLDAASLADAIEQVRDARPDAERVRNLSRRSADNFGRIGASFS